MPVPADPPVAVTPAPFRAWALDVSDTAQDHETRIDTLELGGGGSVVVEDEGVTVVAAATRFDFTGSGVTVTDGGAGQANVAIPGLTDGTWTPTITAGSGTFTSVAATGRYTTFGSIVHFNMDVTITTNGTAATSVVATLPFACRAGDLFIVPGREDAAVGFGLQGKISGGSSSMSIFKMSDSTYPGGTGYILRVSGTYRKA